MEINLQQKYLKFKELCKRWNISSDELHRYISSNEKFWPHIFLDNGAYLLDSEDDFGFKMRLTKENLPLLVYPHSYVYLLNPTMTELGKYEYEDCLHVAKDSHNLLQESKISRLRLLKKNNPRRSRRQMFFFN